jgi:hypothetical protein
MIRNLKILIVAAMALVAFGAIGASGAQAAEFHCSVEPCKVTVKPDGTPGPTGKTAHQVIVIKQGTNSFSTTCDSITGEGTAATKTFKQLRIGNIKGSNCGFSGIPANLTMNGCEYVINASGGGGTLTIACPAGKEIEAGLVGGGCIYNIPSQGPLNEVKFHDAETGGVKKSEVTVELSVKNIAVTVNNECWEMKPGAATAEFTTGNTILTSETTAASKPTSGGNSSRVAKQSR